MRRPSGRARAAPRPRHPAGAQAAGGGGSGGPGAPPPIRPARAGRTGARAAAPPGPSARAQPRAPTLLSRAGRRRRRASSSCCSGRGRPPRSAFGRAGSASPASLALAAPPPPPPPPPSPPPPPPCARRECSRPASASNLGRVAQRGGRAGRGAGGRGRPGGQASAAGPGGAGPGAGARGRLGEPARAAPGRSPGRWREARAHGEGAPSRADCSLRDGVECLLAWAVSSRNLLFLRQEPPSLPRAHAHAHAGAHTCAQRRSAWGPRPDWRARDSQPGGGRDAAWVRRGPAECRSGSDLWSVFQGRTASLPPASAPFSAHFQALLEHKS